MKAIDFVKERFPNATAFSMIDNARGRNSYVVLKHGSFKDNMTNGGNFEIFPNEGAATANKAWTNAKKYIQQNGK